MSFKPQNFVDFLGPVVSAKFLNGLDTTVNNVLAGAKTVTAARAALGITTGIDGVDSVYYLQDAGTVNNLVAAPGTGPVDLTTDSGSLLKTSDTGAQLTTSSNTYQLPTSLTPGMVVRIAPQFSNTGAATLTIGSLGTQPILGIQGQALVGQELQAQVENLFVYLAGSWQLLVANTAQLVGQVVNPQTLNEAAAGVTPTNFYFLPGDPRRYGAVGNGVADDTAALQACFNANSIVEFPGPAYTFNISANLQFSATNGIINGNGSVIQPTSSYTPPTSGSMANVQANINVYNAGTTANGSNVVIQNLVFNGSLYTGASAQNYAVLYQGSAGGLTTGGKVLNCTFIQYPDPVGAAIGFYQGGFEHRAEGNRFLNCHGAVFCQAARSVIDGNVAENPGDSSFVLHSQNCVGSSVVNNKVYNPTGNANNSIGIEEGASDWVIAGNYVSGLNGAGIYLFNSAITVAVRGGVIAENVIDGGGAGITPTGSGIVHGILMTGYYIDCDVHNNIVTNLPPGSNSNSALVSLYPTNSKFHDNLLDATSVPGLSAAVQIVPSANSTTGNTPLQGTLDIVNNRLDNTGGGRGYMLMAGNFNSQRIMFQGGEILSGSVGIDANFTSNTNADLWIVNVQKISSSTVLSVSTNYPALTDFQTYAQSGALTYPHSIKTLSQTVMYGSAQPSTAATGVQHSIVYNIAPSTGAPLLWSKTGISTWSASAAVF